MIALSVATYIPELFATENPHARERHRGMRGTRDRHSRARRSSSWSCTLWAASGNVLSMIIGACIVMAVVLALFGIEMNRRSLEEIAPTPDAESTFATSPLSRESHR